MDYNEFKRESERQFAEQPQEGRDMYKRNFIKIPEEYFTLNGKSKSGQHADMVIKALKDNFGIYFDVIIDGKDILSTSRFAKIVDMADADSGLLKILLEKYPNNKFAALINSKSQKAVVITVKKGESAKINALVLNGEDPVYVQFVVNVEDEGNIEFFQFFCSGVKEKSATGIINIADIGRNANANFIAVHNEGSETAVMNLHHTEIGECSRLSQHFVFTGGSHVKSMGKVKLRGQLSESETNEIVEAVLDQKMDVNTEIVNASKGSAGILESKAVLSDNSVCMLKGFATIEEGATGSRSLVKESSLLMDNTARIESIPGMAIREDDVKATHSASTAPIDEENLFYLLSRGVDRNSAMKLMVDGFIGGSVLKIGDDEARGLAASIIYEKLKNKSIGLTPENKADTVYEVVRADEKAEDMLREHYKYR
jgi:Fe-S cluster assembly scaffold protein SufB